MTGKRMKALHFILAVILLLAMIGTACSKNDNKGASSATPSGENNNASASSAGGSSQAAAEKSKVKITFLEQGWDGPKDDKILPLINEKTGMEIEYEPWIVASDDERRNKLSLLAASGKTPDVFFGLTSDFDRGLFNKMGAQGKLWDLTPFIKKYENVSKMVAWTIPAYRDSATKAMYMYPTQLSINPVWPTGFKIRKDWLDQLGLDYPANPDEFYQVLKAFKEKIKTSSGQPVIPLAFSENLNAGSEGWVVPWFGDDFTIWGKGSDGSYTLKPYTDIPRLQNMLAFYNRLYREGLLDRDALTIKTSQLKEKIGQDRVGVQFMRDYEYSGIVDTLKSGGAKDAMYVVLPWFFEQGVQGAFNGELTLAPGAPSALFISKKLSETQVDDLFKVLEWMLSPEGQVLTNYGIEGEHWEKDANGKVVPTQAFKDLTQGDWNKAAQVGVGYYAQLSSITKEMREMQPVDSDNVVDKINLENQLKQWAPDPLELDKMSYVSPGPIEQSKKPSIDQAWTDMAIKAIMADSEDEARKIAEGWQKTLKNLGWDDIVNERNTSVQTIDMNY